MAAVNDLISLCYVSRSLIGEDPAQLVDIWEAAERNNEANGLSGALYFDGEIFFQVIEGQEKDVQETFEKIQKDTRHADLKVLSEYFCATRSLGYWNMKVISKFNDSHRQSMFQWSALADARMDDINRRIRCLIAA